MSAWMFPFVDCAPTTIVLVCVTGASSPGLFTRTETTALTGRARGAVAVAAAAWSVLPSCALACGSAAAVRPADVQSCEASCVVAASFAAVPATAVVLVCATGPLSPGLLIRTEIKAENGVWVLRDSGSMNGTYVNNRRVDRHELVDNDFIKFGSAMLKFKSL